MCESSVPLVWFSECLSASDAQLLLRETNHTNERNCMCCRNKCSTTATRLLKQTWSPATSVPLPVKTVAGANGRVRRGLIKARTSSKEVKKKERFWFIVLIRIYRILDNVFKQRCIHKRVIIVRRETHQRSSRKRFWLRLFYQLEYRLPTVFF